MYAVLSGLASGTVDSSVWTMLLLDYCPAGALLLGMYPAYAPAYLYCSSET